MAKHVLITGFEPLRGSKINPSELVVRSLEGRAIAGRPIVAQILPVETRTMRQRLAEILAINSPDLIVLTGVAAGRCAVAVERVALNVLDFEQPDNVGCMRTNAPVEPGGPDARLSNLPFERIVSAWNENGIPGYISNSAGTYLCNQALYQTLGLTENAHPPVLAGFIHCPYLPSQAIQAGAQASPSMSLDLMKRSIEILIETVIPRIDERLPDLQTADAGAMWIPRGEKEVTS
ncbi:MAG: pyroglutamyl-peptidase I [Vulcanimicrobiaceae bacterium]